MLWNAYAEGKEPLFGFSIKSCGHIFAKKGRKICRPQGREDFLLFYVFKGSETFHLQETVTAEEGSFILFRPHEAQDHICEWDKTAEFYYVHFMVDENAFPLGLESSVVYHSEPCSAVSALFESLLSELQLKQTAYEQIAVGKLIELFGVLKRKTEKKTNLSKEHFGKIAGIVQHIHRNYEKDETLEVYAQMCALSKFHFLRKFEAITGMTPIAYRNRIRLSHAKEKLEDLSLSVSEIAFSCGYSSAAYFCDAFKREYGLSPNTYRAAKQEGDPR